MKMLLMFLLMVVLWLQGQVPVAAQSTSPTPVAVISTPSATPAPSPSPVVEAASPAPSPAVEAPPEPTFIEKLWEILKSSGGIIAGAIVIFEIFVRAFPTKNPLSILVPVKHFVDTLALILSWLSNTVLIPMINAANKSQEKLAPK